jgi:hypothetical protein
MSVVVETRIEARQSEMDARVSIIKLRASIGASSPSTFPIISQKS